MVKKEQSTSPELAALREVIVAANALPVLFVGSGMSRRYIGSPDWDGLLEQFASLTNRAISFYRGRADGDRPKIASLIAEKFYDIWFNSDEYAESRESYEAEVEKEADPLKFEIAKSISGLPYIDDPEVKRELEALSRVRAHAIVTTNYDTVFDDNFPDLEVFVGQQDVLFATTQTIGEIYKIHGSVTDPKSMVLTSEDYAEYWERNPYLIAKLLTMLVEHPVMFLGYSLGDAHINRMLSNLIACLTPEQIDVLNDRLIFVRRPEHGETGALARSSMTVGQHTLSIREFVCTDYQALYGTLGELPQQFPVKLLRQLRESVYELTFSAEPSGRVHVLPMDDDANPDEIEVVVGIGTLERLGERGYRAFTRADLCRDMLAGAKDHNPNRLLHDLLPRLFRSAKFVPIYYPLLATGRIGTDNNVTDTEGLPANARALISGTTKLRPYRMLGLAERRAQTFRELLAEDRMVALDFGLVCSYEVEDVVALRDFLTTAIGDAESVETMAAKLSCKYDRLVYGPDFEGDRKEMYKALGVDSSWIAKCQRH
ncbi:SIR2 family protein [Blastococcus saxobsidens]|uniref:SIR2-like protein n=1 Tax=Blastococcus saxobsidens TaxID=138336 RepID=A0A4Q7Y255_9ACTN|nr:SIR2 family protein [Blastococcus saxobsidens]RZU30882.1 SIR2-like protein [Blastococcus saxobsidens]